MNEFPVRMRYLLDHLRVGASELADNLGVQRSSVSHLISGRNKPGMDFLEKLALYYPAISLEWFITGKGDIEKESRNLFTQEPEKPLRTADEPEESSAGLFTATTVQDEEPARYGKKVSVKQGRVRKVILVYDNGTAEVHDVT